MLEGEDFDFEFFVVVFVDDAVELFCDIGDHFDVFGGAGDEGDAGFSYEADGGGGGDDAEAADGFKEFF